MITEKNVTYQYIANATNGATDTVTLAKDIAVNSLALVRSSTGAVQESNMSAQTDKFYIVNKLADGTLLKSPEFYMPKATITSQVYVAPAEQVSYWGYNASTGVGGLGTITSGNVYALHVELITTAPSVNNSAEIKTVVHKATAATEYNVANGLLTNFYKTFAREAYPMIKAELVSSATTVASSGGTWLLNNGSEIVSVAEDGNNNDAGKYNGDAADVAVGDFIRFGHATTKTYPVYRVTAISGDADRYYITLDRPYQGTTDAALAAASVGIMPSATGLAGTFGIQLTGLNRFATKAFNPVSDYYSKVRFEVTSDDFDSTATFTTVTQASEGAGSYYEVAQDEVYAAANEYAGRYLQAYPPTKYREQAVSGNTYDTITLACYDNSYVNAVTGIQPVSQFTIVLRMLVGLNGDDVDTAFNVTV